VHRQREFDALLCRRLASVCAPARSNRTSRRATATNERLVESSREVVSAGLGASTLRGVVGTGALRRILHPCVSIRTATLRDTSSTLCLANGLAGGRLRAGYAVAQRRRAVSESAVASRPGKGHAGVAARSAMSVVCLEVLDAVAVPARCPTQADTCLLTVASQVAETLIAREAGAIDGPIRPLTARAACIASAADLVARRLRVAARVEGNLTARTDAASFRSARFLERLLDADVGDADEAREALTAAALTPDRSEHACGLGFRGARGERCVGRGSDEHEVQETRGPHGRPRISRFASRGEPACRGEELVGNGR
jgi:hypothetical protein